jgi:hypothetical protein
MPERGEPLPEIEYVRMNDFPDSAGLRACGGLAHLPEEMAADRGQERSYRAPAALRAIRG